MPFVERRLRAMGTECQVLVSAAPGAATLLADAACARVELLEQSWSRFRPASELSRLNARAGSGPVEVSADLLALVDTMRSAWHMTDGLFDPTVLESVRALGYDTDYADVIARGAVQSATSFTGLQRSPGMTGVSIDLDASTVELPAGVGLDPGAIGKGLAADLIVDELRAAGADGVLVNLGGDVVFAGAPADDPHWAIEVVDERAPREAADRTLRTLDFEASVERGAVATSTTLKRRWGAGIHHLVDPRTGRMAEPELVQATVSAAYGWQAEAAATAVLLMGAEKGQAWLESLGLPGLLVSAEQLVTAAQPVGANHG